MQEALAQLCIDLMNASNAATAAARQVRWTDLREAARQALSAASKLHSRAGLLSELAMEDGFAAAEVDRAIARAEKWHQTTVEEQLANVAKRDQKPRKPRTPKGGKGGA